MSFSRSILALLLAVSTGVAFQSQAEQLSQESDFSLQSSPYPNAFTITGRAPVGTHWVWVRVEKDPPGETQDQDAFVNADEGGHFQTLSTFRQGPGRYTVYVYGSESLERPRHFPLLSQFFVNNPSEADPTLTKLNAYDPKDHYLFAISSAKSQNSELQAVGQIPAGAKVWIQVSKLVSKDPLITAPVSEVMKDSKKDGRYFSKLYLKDGAGDYRVSFWVSTDQPGLYRRRAEFSVTNQDTRDLKFLAPSDKVQSDHPGIVKLAREITADAKTDFDKVLMIHDWVATHLKYDRAIMSDPNSDLPTHALESGVAVCSGYSNTLASLARAVGIPTKLISGASAEHGQAWAEVDTTKANHAWNEVFVDGHWITVDVTWDSGFVDLTSNQWMFELKHKYLDAPDAVFQADHFKIQEDRL